MIEHFHMQICTALHSTAQHCFTVEHIATTTGGQTWLVPTEHPNLVGVGRKPVDLSSRIEPWGKFNGSTRGNPSKRRKDKETTAHLDIVE